MFRGTELRSLISSAGELRLGLEVVEHDAPFSFSFFQMFVIVITILMLKLMEKNITLPEEGWHLKDVKKFEFAFTFAGDKRRKSILINYI